MKARLFPAVIICLLLTICTSCSGGKTAAQTAALTSAAGGEVQTAAVQQTASQTDDGAASHTVTYSSQNGGRVKGTSVQTVARGMTGDEVTAVPDLGYRFSGWSDGSAAAARSDTPMTDLTLTASFVYDAKTLPVVTLTTSTGDDVQSKTEYIAATFQISNAPKAEYDTGELSIRIRGRGNNSWSYPKKSYKFKLDEKANLLGICSGKEKVYTLIANQCDQSLLRNWTAYKLGAELDGIAFTPGCTSVDVYLNGEYRGVYLLTEDIGISSHRVDISESPNSTETAFMAEMTGYADHNVFNAGDHSYQVASDLSEDSQIASQQMTYITDTVQNAWDAMVGGDEAEIEKAIDLDSFIDCYIWEETLKNLDAAWDSFYVWYKPGGKLTFGPMWDFDLSLGNANEGEETTSDIFVGAGRGSNGGKTWYSLAMRLDWFRAKAKARWLEVADTINAFPGRIQAEAEANYDCYCRNFEKWKIFGTCQNRETSAITSLHTYKGHYQYLVKWAQTRISWLYDYLDTDDYSGGAFVTLKAATNFVSKTLRGDLGDEETKTVADKYTSLESSIDADSVSGPDGFNNEVVTNLFDDSSTTKYCWQSNGTTTVTFSADKPLAVKAYALMTANDTENYPDRNPVSWKLYGSTTKGGAWNIIASDNGSRLFACNYTWFAYEAQVPGEYQYFKLELNGGGDILQLAAFELLG